MSHEVASSAVALQEVANLCTQLRLGGKEDQQLSVPLTFGQAGKLAKGLADAVPILRGLGRVVPGA